MESSPLTYQRTLNNCNRKEENKKQGNAFAGVMIQRFLKQNATPQRQASLLAYCKTALIPIIKG